MNLFIDTNIIVELLENRSEANYVDEIFSAAEQKKWVRYISVGSFYTLTYLIERMLRKQNIHQPELNLSLRTILNDILQAFCVSPIGCQQLMDGVNDPAFADLEDSYQHQAAISAECDVLLTINKKDFSFVTDIDVLTPKEFKQRYL